MSGSTPVTLLEVVRQLLSVAREVSGADGVTFVLRDGDQCSFADESAIAPLWKGRRFPMATCLAGWVMLNAQAVALEDIYADPRISADAYRSTFVQSLVVVPVRREAPVAAVGAHWATPHRPDERAGPRLPAIAEAAGAAPAIEAKRHVLTVSFPTDAVVRGDAERLAQVASNLVSNAVKFTPAGGSVEVRLARTGHAVTLVVSDSGVGIAPDVLPHVFDRFREADGGVPRKYSGLGVGLAIARHLVALHRGRVRAERAGEVRGSTLSVEVPIRTIVPTEGATIS